MGTQAELRFTHFGIHVTDVAGMEDFYTRVLEFTVTDRGPFSLREGSVHDLVFLSRDPDEHHQIILVSGRPRDLPFNVVNQISLRTDTLPTLQKFYRRFVAEKMADISPLTHGNAISVYSRDPEGNRLEVYWPTPWYTPQPCGVRIDLERPEADIMAEVEAIVAKLPGSRPAAQRRAEMAARMGLELAE